MAYASALSRHPAETYRRIDIAGRTAAEDGPGLVQLLYEELVSALRSAGWAADHRQLQVRSERVTRATAILFALEAGLDFDKGGDLSKTLSSLYRGGRNRLLEVSLGVSGQPLRALADEFDEIGEAWKQARAAA